MPGLYIHIPFCRKKCAYCDFLSFPDAGRSEAYPAYLLREMALWQNAVTVETVFIGGGTPSLLPARAIETILSAVRAYFPVAPDAEITLECNPGSAQGKLSAYRRAGVNRLSVGLQAAQEGMLRMLGRIHRPEQFEDTLREARAAGLTNLNADVMYGLPGQTENDYLATLEYAVKSGARHISAYELILEEGTPLAERVRLGALALPDEERSAGMEAQGRVFLERHGFGRYEISNYARPGYPCRHNLNYWDNGEYLGLGLGAHSALRAAGGWTRHSNAVDFSEYESRLERGEKPVEKIERIPIEEEMFETAMLGLRKVDGIRADVFAARFGRSFFEAYPQAKALADDGLLLAGGAIRLTERGLDLQNQVLLRLMP